MDCFLRLCLQSWSFIRPDFVVKIMVRHCIAYGCVNRSNKPECSKLSWHSLPINNAKLLRTWLLKMKRKDPPVSKHSYLCSQHFSEDFFYALCGRKTISEKWICSYKIQFFTGGKAKAESSCLSLSCT